MSDGPLTAARDGVRVAIRLSPRASADRLVGIGAAAASGRMLKATVTAPAEGGRANEALLQMLARAWHLPRRDLSIIQGAANRNKVVHIAGDSRQLIENITAKLSGLSVGETGQ